MSSQTCHLEPTTKAYVKLQWQIIEQLFLRINELTSEELHALGEAKNKLEVIMATGDMPDFEKEKFPDELAVWLEKELLRIPLTKDELKLLYGSRRTLLQTLHVAANNESLGLLLDERAKYRTVREENAFIHDCKPEEVAMGVSTLKKDTVALIRKGMFESLKITSDDILPNTLRHIQEVEIKLKPNPGTYLGEKTALKLIELGQADLVDKEIAKFKQLSKEVAIKLIEAHKTAWLKSNFNEFQIDSVVSHREIFKQLKRTYGMNIAEAYINKFPKNILNDPELIQICLTEKYRKDASFENEYGTWVTDYIEDGTFARVIAESLDHIDPHFIDHNKLAQQLIDEEKTSVVADNLSKFKGLSNSIKQQCIGKGYQKAVDANPSSFLP